MINLLPTNAKKSLVLERRIRLLSFWLLVLAFGIFLAAALALPTGILLARFENSMSSYGDLEQEVRTRREQVERDLKETHTLVEYLSKDVKARDHSLIISDLDRLSEDEVTLTHFNFDDKDKLVLSGVASTRAALSAFRDRLDAHELFKSVELPLSSLVKDTEVPFSITITMR